MNSLERKEKRYQRRKEKRLENKKMRVEALDEIDEIFSFVDMFKYGKQCCNGVRWKNSIQRYELHLFSNTAKARKKVLDEKWSCEKYTHFVISERGKKREIDAPKIQDRQIHKTIVKNILLPLYEPDIIWNNGASLKGKGIDFSKRELKKDLCNHYKKYGREGNIILIDFKKFFPSASHEIIKQRHKKLILDEKIRKIADIPIDCSPCGIGVPLGVEPSQIEMIGLPSPLDNYLKCQLSLKGMGHYMDDYHILVPPNRDAKEILNLFIKKAKELNLSVNRDKTCIRSLTKAFKFCKATFLITETGKIIIRGNRDGVKRGRKKIKSLKNKIEKKEITYMDLYNSMNSTLSYFEFFNDHNRVLKLRRLFFSIYGFSCENRESFYIKDLYIKNKKDEELKEIIQKQEMEEYMYNFFNFFTNEEESVMNCKNNKKELDILIKELF